MLQPNPTAISTGLATSLDADRSQQGHFSRAITSLCDPANPADVAAVVTDRLEDELQTGRLRCGEGPIEMPQGWEAHVYRFRLQSQNDLRAPYNGPLAIRAYDTPHALRRARHEFAVMHEVSALGFPAPKPLLLEQECLLLGGPFLILPWVDGVNLLDWLRQKFVRVLAVARQLARVHCALHELPTSGCVASAVQFLDRRLDELEVMISNFGLDEIADGLQWLRLRRPATEMRPSILHLDFHPINIVVDAQGAPNAVLDWSDADIGDRHADVAMTLVLLRTAPVDVTSLSEKFVKRPARWLLARRYLRVYQHTYPLDPARLTYYTAWAALRRLAVSCTWRRAGPWVHGFKKSAVRYANRSHERALRQVFRDATGISLRSVP